jgi:hypothetical protein
MKYFLIGLLISLLVISSFVEEKTMQIKQEQTIDSLGACQGVSIQKGKVFLYGDREVGMIREYQLSGDSLVYQHHEMKLTLHDSDLINHPTGIAFHGKMPAFIGNSIRMNKEGSLWKAVIYCINWEGLQKTKTLDGNLINTIDDDTCIQGTRPEYVQYKNKWYVATADYGGKNNEVRLYDPWMLKNAKRSSEKNVLVKKFSCSPWVQNLYWMADKGVLVLVQNQIEGRKWRFTFLDLEKSLSTGSESVIKVIDINGRQDELEGFSFFDNHYNTGIAVTSSKKHNSNLIIANW